MMEFYSAYSGDTKILDYRAYYGTVVSSRIVKS